MLNLLFVVEYVFPQNPISTGKENCWIAVETVFEACLPPHYSSKLEKQQHQQTRRTGSKLASILTETAHCWPAL